MRKKKLKQLMKQAQPIMRRVADETSGGACGFCAAIGAQTHANDCPVWLARVWLRALEGLPT